MSGAGDGKGANAGAGAEALVGGAADLRVTDVDFELPG
jgi:hypothetical protein